MYALAQNFRSTFRQLRKSPGFTLTVVLTLALGIGATTAIFSIVEGILLRPLPFRHPDRLVLLGDHLGRGVNTPVTAREIGTYSSATRAFSSLGGYATASYEFSGAAIPEQVEAARLTAGVFPTLGVQPILGRASIEDDARPGHGEVALLSYRYWQAHYGGNPSVLGRVLTFNGHPRTIIGVMPPRFLLSLIHI